MSARAELLEELVRPDVFDRTVPDIELMQLAAAREVTEVRLPQLKILRRRAEEFGTTEITQLADLIPLLLAHTSYKSYPAGFMERGQWDRMLQWLQTLSTATVTDVDVEGVRDADDWIARLRGAGHMVQATSGTTGKVSFLNHSVGDVELKRRHYRTVSGWPYLKADNSRAVFIVGPSAGSNSAVEAFHNNVAAWARPGEAYFLSDEPILVSEISRMAALRLRMAEGTATIDEIASAEQEAALKSERMKASLRAFTEKLMAYRHEPISMAAQWSPHLMIIEQARAMGVPDGDFHPQSLISAGGGIKGVALPPDYKEQVARFYGDVVQGAAYGMTELASTMPRCEHGRYHRPPSLIWLPLDQPGERLLGPEDAIDGIVEARFAFLDLVYEGRWGGMITGDKVQVDFAPVCACGRPGPTILDTISRFSEAGKEDHIGCAGTIDAYIRGALAA